MIWITSRKSILIGMTIRMSNKPGNSGHAMHETGDNRRAMLTK